MAQQRPTCIPTPHGCPRIERIVIREVRYQLDVNQCRNEEIIVKGNFGWAWSMLAWPMWAGHPRIIRIAIREVQYQFEDIRCMARTDGQMDGRKTEITTYAISPLFLRKAWG
ncbi:hypothetical protein DPMN_092493 [Dreissena polymorpha]|uniref:Uncharacterized protein n=1 Tax=Dreissena polymorpha TaxID=45954 RepID=A0A9D4L1F9_DREPO|nr:hypothetical protein DPMN_092493 [Dreissena polymorpha]